MADTDNPLSMKERRSHAEIEAVRQARRISIKPEQLIETDPQSAAYIKPSDFAQDPITHRYIITYEPNGTSVRDGLLYGEAKPFNEDQKRAFIEVLALIEENNKYIKFKNIADTTAAERGNRFLQVSQGDIDISWADNFGINYVQGVVSIASDEQRAPMTKKTLVIDNDWRQQALALDHGYWKKGGVGWDVMAHEVLHALGLKHGKGDTIMEACTIQRFLGTKNLGIREPDWKALELIWGAPPASPATEQVSSDPHPSGLPPSAIYARPLSSPGTPMKQRPR